MRPFQPPSRLARRLAILLPLVMMVVLASVRAGWSADREELGRILQAIPPNGPHWRFGNVVMRTRSKGDDISPAVFTHWNHRAYYMCRICHQELGFSMWARTTGVTMAQNRQGKYCGVCHDGTTAFTVEEGEKRQCQRCHIRDTQALERSFDLFAKHLPIAAFGNGIDWSEVVARGHAEPIRSVLSDLPPMKLPDNLKKPVRLATTSPRSDVTFSHETHFNQLDCSNCHPDIFSIRRKGTEAFSMERNIFGNFCGACHMKVAFPMQQCRKCHPAMGTYSGS